MKKTYDVSGLLDCIVPSKGVEFAEQLDRFVKYTKQDRYWVRYIDRISKRYSKLKIHDTTGNEIREAILEVTGVDIIGKTFHRERPFVTARQMYAVLRKSPQVSLARIGQEMQGVRPRPFDHATILHYLQNHKDLMETNREYRELFDKVQTKLNQIRYGHNQTTTEATGNGDDMEGLHD